MDVIYNNKYFAKEKIILASSSPRRKEILERNGINFEVVVPSCEEKKIVGEKYSEELANDCAVTKAKAVYHKIVKENAQGNEGLYLPGEASNANNANIIVSCDTVVVNDGIIVGKPKDENDAVKTLKLLSGKTHIVASSVCVMKDGDIKVTHEITKVTFRRIDDDEIKDYIARCKPLDKAGSYGIQDPGFDFAIKVDGEIDNVIGFPMKAFNKIIKEYGMSDY